MRLHQAARALFNLITTRETTRDDARIIVITANF